MFLKLRSQLQMIIPNPIVKLEYDPVRDVLSVEWPEIRDYTVSEAVYILNTVIETVRRYDVKYLLTDTRKGTVDIPEHQYREIIVKFARDLATTRLQKIARVVTESTRREGLIHEVTNQAHLSIPIHNFYSMEDALSWLSSNYECLY